MDEYTSLGMFSHSSGTSMFKHVDLCSSIAPKKILQNEFDTPRNVKEGSNKPSHL